MYRHCTSILLIAVHLASQLALVPHTHGVHGLAQPADENSRPHVHLGWLGGGSHTHSHTHAHGHSHEHGEVATHSHILPSSGHCSHLAVDCHDCDAVYLPTDIGAPVIKGEKESGQFAVDLATVPIAAVMWAPPEPPERLMHRVFPIDSTPSCARYLILRALRI